MWLFIANVTVTLMSLHGIIWSNNTVYAVYVKITSMSLQGNVWPNNAAYDP